MRKIYSLVCALALGAFSATMLADNVPFYPTAVVGGQLADTTRWYTMTIGEDGFVIGQPSGSHIELNAPLTAIDDANLWCFVGDDTQGYTIYNKATGMSKVLAAPTTAAASGSTSFATLVDAAQAGYTTRWSFTTSALRKSKYAETAVFLHPFGTTVSASNQNGKLAFNTASANTEAVLIEFGQQRRNVNLSEGAFTAWNTTKTYASTWTSSKTSPSLLLLNGGRKNNMDRVGNELRLATVNSPDYTLETGRYYTVARYGFAFTSPVAMTVSGKGASVTAAANTSTPFAVTGVDTMSTSFTLTPSSGRSSITTSDFYVVLERSFNIPKEVQQTYVFPYESGGMPYRIPAIVSTPAGRVLAFSDQRPGGADIGHGLTHIVMKASDDFGKTWGAEQMIAQGTNNRSDGYRHSFGDAAVVADCESEAVLLYVAAGYMSYQGSSAADPLRIACFRSTDGGRTWDNGTEKTQHFYQLFAGRQRGQMSSLFMTSGRIHQSRYVKVGQYYRLYAALATREGNYAVYSDDFGQNWSILGSNEVSPIADGDEVKCEELPDGSVLLSARTSNARLFNVFTFTNPLTGEGAWDNRSVSNSANRGINPVSNAINAEALVVPVRRLSDNQPSKVILHTICYGPGRANVGFYFKEAERYEQVGTASALAADWTKSLQLTQMNSGYSSFVLQKDDSIGVLYEEATFGPTYTLVYRKFSVEELTNGLYTLDRSATQVDSAYTQTAVAARTAHLQQGNKVGMLKDLAPVEAAKNAYLAMPNKANAEAVTAALYAPQNRLQLEEGRWYRIVNKQYPTYALTGANGTLSSATMSTASALHQLFQVTATTDGWFLRNGNYENYADSIGADNAKVPATATPRVPYAITSDLNGLSLLHCLQTKNTNHAYLHRASNGNVVGWTNSADASQWMIEPVDTVTVSLYSTPESGVFVQSFCLPFAYTVADGARAYKAVAATDSLYCSAVETVPSKTGVLLKSDSRTAKLVLTADVAPLADNLLQGVLAAKSVGTTSLLATNTTTSPVFRPSTSTTVPANRAYLPLTDSTRPVSFAEIATGIAAIEAGTDASRAIFYDLSGRRIAQPSKGVFITKGKKVVR